MHYITNASGYLTAVSFGCDIECGGSECVEYTGSVPTGYTSLEAWYAAESETLYRWKISSGKLVVDNSATPPRADDPGVLHLNKITDTEHIIPEGADFNDYTTPGVYRCATSPIAQTLKNGPAYTGAGFRLIVSAVSASNGVTHTAIYNSLNFHKYERVQNSDKNWSGWRNAGSASDGDLPNCTYIYTTDGVKEWINPPMTIGVEYRTTERYNRKPVYYKLINFGGLPSSGHRSIEHNIADIEDIPFASCSARNGGEVAYIPGSTANTYDSSADILGSTWQAGATTAHLHVTTNADRTAWTGRFFIKYTKTTDSEEG